MLSIEEQARRLVEHPRWSWTTGIVRVWPMAQRTVLVLGETDHDTLLVALVGSGAGVEIDPKEHDLYPDLTHPATAGILLSLWLKSSPQAWMSICRWGDTGQPASLTEVRPKRWSITMDLGTFDQDAEGSYLGSAIAEMLYLTWQRQSRLTPALWRRPEPEEL